MNSKQLLEWLRKEDISSTQVDMQELLKLLQEYFLLKPVHRSIYDIFDRV